METRVINGVTLLFDTNEQETAKLFADACTESIRVIRESWELEAPSVCRVYVMTSWMRFFFHSASWPRCVLYAATLPLWYARVRKLWPLIGGWTQLYRHRPAVGVKPPRLFDIADKSLGEKIYLKDEDLNRKVQCTICHEMTHAFSAHLKLPLWLNEGVAMVTVDRFVGKPTVKPETIETFRSYPRKTRPAKPRDLVRMNVDSIAYQYIRGYWITRYLENAHPGLVKSLLSRRQRTKSLERQVAAELEIRPKLFRREIDQVVAGHFDFDQIRQYETQGIGEHSTSP